MEKNKPRFRLSLTVHNGFMVPSKGRGSGKQL